MNYTRFGVLFLPFIFLAVIPAFAQSLEADFDAPQFSGCAPLTMAFTNTTKNASSAAVYQWNLDKGPLVIAKEAGTIYTEEKTYNVTLTVTDGANTSVKTKTVTVHKKPEVELLFPPARGCAPLTVAFNARVTTSPDATVALYSWDYGDGKTEQGSMATPTHTYTAAQIPAVSLTIKDSHGCTASTTQANNITVLEPVKAGFVPAVTAACAPPIVIGFTNNSTGPGILSWKWDFGDGNTSTEKQPAHNYTAKGTFKPALTVTSSEGCAGSFQWSQGINIANFTTDFTAPAKLCTNQKIEFIPNTIPTPDTVTWRFSDGGVGNPHLFNTPGEQEVTMIAHYGSCELPVTKKLVLLQSPKLSGIETQNNGACGAPATFSFKDTNNTAVKWLWTVNGAAAGSTPGLSYTFNTNGNYLVRLEIENALGCTDTLLYPLYLFKPIVRIYYENSTTADGISGCEGFTTTFATISSEEIVNYEWNFGDGGTAVEEKPTYTFNKAGGPYNLRLNYTTTSGCKGTEYLNNIMVYKKPGVSFVMKEPNPICGNTPVHFEANVTNAAESWNWYYRGDYNERSIGSSLGTVQYDKEGTYTVILVASIGTCRDTVVRTNLVTVLPPFPKIREFVNSCDAQRGNITFKEDSRLAESWSWDFGDGATLDYNTVRPTVTHNYKATGGYKVVLSTTNGQCTTRDSIQAYVLLKQKPVLAINQGIACASDTLLVTVVNQEASPYGETPDGDFSVSYQPFVKGVPLDVNGKIAVAVASDWTQTYHARLTWLPPGTDSVRVFTRTIPFGCRDTSNFVAVKIKGPDAAFAITENGVCFNKPNKFTDRSILTYSKPLTTWQLDFGDGQQETVHTSEWLHTYANPGEFRVKLKVTDADGCFDTARHADATVAGTKANFSWAPESVKPDTDIRFTNNSTTYGAATVNYTWRFSYDKTSLQGNNAFSPLKRYPGTGVDTVKLLAANVAGACRDSITKLVYIKNVHANFSLTSSYVNGNNCPPLLASFTNSSSNYASISWNFGDGSTAGNVNTPSHTYTTPGTYEIKLYAFDAEGDVDSTSRTVVVSGPFGIFKATTPQVCGAPAVITFTAVTQNITEFTWDFGDGTLLNTKELTVQHNYKTPGVYKPTIGVKDDKGCPTSFTMEKPVLVDTLKATFSTVPVLVCDSGFVSFLPQVVNIAADQLQLQPRWHWNFGTGKPEDTANIANPSFFFNKIGTYKISLKVTSAGGCVKTVEHTITVRQKTKATITAPAAICRQSDVSLAGTANGNVEQWTWDFADGNIQRGTPAPTHTYQDQGDYKVLLIVANGGCLDTATHWLTVRALPDIGLTPAEKAVLCLGDSIRLTAHNGVSYQWTPAQAITSTNSADPKVFPVANTTYKVRVADQYGCVNHDSVAIQLAYPFTVNLRDTGVCRGSSVELQATGADSYRWIDGDALNNTSIGNPLAAPAVSNRYTVIGSDRYGCFTATASATVTVHNLPTVSTIPDTTIIAGYNIKLPTRASGDVVSYKWLPALYLDCTNCPEPVSTPRKALSYIVTAATVHGCTATDTITVKLRCEQTNVFIPNTFTPNKDGRNDRFYPRGKGVKLVKFFRIYNRLGEMIFERRNFDINDPAQGWDGSYNGNPVANNMFTYTAEMTCDAEDVFELKGTVLLLR